jgi:hypothetical protein
MGKKKATQGNRNLAKTTALQKADLWMRSPSVVKVTLTRETDPTKWTVTRTRR